MGRRHICWWIGWALAGLSTAQAALAQVRGGTEPPRRHRQHLHHRAAAVSEPTGAWTAARSEVIVSADSLFGVSYYQWSITDDRPDLGDDRLSGPSVHVFTGAEKLDPFGLARFGIDGVIAPGITLGGSIGYSSLAASRHNSLGDGADEDLGSMSTFVIVPRLGFLLAPNSYVAFWLRGGVGYASISGFAPSKADDSLNGVALVVDPMLIVSPVPHAGILIGPSLNMGLTGGETGSADSAHVTNKFSSYGASAGIALLF